VNAELTPIENTKRHFASFPGKYWIAGGWAIDLHVGRKTREHKDVEIAIARNDQQLLLQLPDLSRIEYIENRTVKIWKGQRLELPVHEMYCHFNSGHILEVLLNEFTAADWLYRRNTAIHLAKNKFINKNGAPLPLEVVLLFKAKHRREKDDQDFMSAFPILGPDKKDWLRQALKTEDQNHPWIKEL
jgi:hypothetical protein